MIEFAYNNAKNASKGYMFFKLNYKYYLYIFHKKNVKPRLRLKASNKLTKELRNLKLYLEKPYNIPKNYRNEPIIKKLSLQAIFSIRKFD